VFKDKSICITGGTRSFAHDCIQVLADRCAPQKLIVYSRDELQPISAR